MTVEVKVFRKQVSAMLLKARKGSIIHVVDEKSTVAHLIPPNISLYEDSMKENLDWFIIPAKNPNFEIRLEDMGQSLIGKGASEVLQEMRNEGRY